MGSRMWCGPRWEFALCPSSTSRHATGHRQAFDGETDKLGGHLAVETSLHVAVAKCRRNPFRIGGQVVEHERLNEREVLVTEF